MTVVAAAGDPPAGEAIERAARALASGQIVALPTDTVYGLAADPFRTGAADRIFTLKRRPRDVQLPVLVADVDQALSLASAIPAVGRRLMRRFWPGALTIILPRDPELTADLGTDDATIGVRCPAHPVPRALCHVAGPLATTSANRHGEPPLTNASDVASAFGKAVSVVLDGGPCTAKPSTVVDCTGQEPKLLREGAISWEEVMAATHP